MTSGFSWFSLQIKVICCFKLKRRKISSDLGDLLNNGGFGKPSTHNSYTNRTSTNPKELGKEIRILEFLEKLKLNYFKLR
jgi:hypothetical protein